MNSFSKIVLTALFFIFQKKKKLDTNGKKKSIAKKTSTPFIVFQNFENESSTTIDALGFQKKRWQILCRDNIYQSRGS
jgi:hypothetical protein